MDKDKITITVSREDMAILARALRVAKEQALKDYGGEQAWLVDFKERHPNLSANMVEAGVRVAQKAYQLLNRWSRETYKVEGDGRRNKLVLSSKE